MSFTTYTLGAVSDIFNGKTPAKSEQRELGHPVLKIKNVSERGEFKGAFESFVDFDLFENFKHKALKLDDTLILNAAHNSDYVGSKQYRAEQSVVGSLPTGEWLVARAKGNLLDANYLNYWFDWPNTKFQIKGLVKGIHLYPKDVARLKINLPPLPEQKRIAAILDKADAIRRKRQQAIKLADDFLRSVFLEMFGDPVTNPKGWERCKFEDLTDMVTYGLTVRPEYIDDGIPLISAKEIRSGTINLKICSRISEADLDALSSKARPNYGDILFSKTGSIGHSALVDTVEPFAITQNAARVVPHAKRCVSHFLLGLLRTKYFYNLANKEAKGNAVKDLQLGVMKSFPVYAPPLELQKKYSKIFQKFIGQSLLQEAALKRAEESFNSLNQKAFLGEL